MCKFLQCCTFQNLAKEGLIRYSPFLFLLRFPACVYPLMSSRGDFESFPGEEVARSVHNLKLNRSGGPSSM